MPAGCWRRLSYAPGLSRRLSDGKRGNIPMDAFRRPQGRSRACLLGGHAFSRTSSWFGLPSGMRSESKPFQVSTLPIRIGTKFCRGRRSRRSLGAGRTAPARKQRRASGDASCSKSERVRTRPACLRRSELTLHRRHGRDDRRNSPRRLLHALNFVAVRRLTRREASCILNHLRPGRVCFR